METASTGITISDIVRQGDNIALQDGAATIRGVACTPDGKLGYATDAGGTLSKLWRFHLPSGQPKGYLTYSGVSPLPVDVEGIAIA